MKYPHLVIRLRHVELVVEAAPHSAGSVLPEERHLELLNHVVVQEAEEEGNRHALAGGCHRGHHLVDVF